MRGIPTSLVLIFYASIECVMKGRSEILKENDEVER